MEDIKLSYDDICIIPEVVTDIKSRTECNCYDENGMLPIFAAPMNTVVDKECFDTFITNRINAIIPRTEALINRMYFLKSVYFETHVPYFVAFSLKEVKDIFLQEIELTGKENGKPYYVCIDMANGHMSDLIETIREIKKRYGNKVVIMTGNIANPETYRLYEEAGVDFCRCGIGGGDACLTSTQLGLHMPYFSLLKEIYDIKKEINGKCKIIADGNIRGYRDIQKALIYADYVMIGSLFNKALESAGKTTYGKFYWNVRGYKIFRPFKTLFNYGKEVPKAKYGKITEDIKAGKVVIWKKFYGMSTKQAQEAILKGNGKAVGKLKTSEGVVKYQKVEYTLNGWVKNETDYLRSAMSYTNSRDLKEYKESRWVKINQIRHNQ